MEHLIGNAIGGVNYTNPPNELMPYYMADSDNIVPSSNGYATKRGGSSKLNTSMFGTNITSFHELKVGNISNKFAVSGSILGKLSSGSFVTYMQHLTDGAFGKWINYGDYAIYTNGYDSPKKTDGTTVSDLTSDLSGLVGADALAEWGERVWTNIDSKLIGSALRDPTDFSSTVTDIGYFEGFVGDKNDPIRGLTPYFDMLLVGKLNQIYTMTGAPETRSSTFRIIPLSTKDKDSFGFTSKNGIALVGNDLLFLDGFSIKSLSGVTSYGDVESLNIVGNIKDFLRDGANLDTDYLKNTHFFHYKHKEQVWCSIPTGEYTRYWFIIDYSNQGLKSQLDLPKYSFYPMSGFTPLCFGSVENGTKMDIYAGCADGYVRQLDTGYNDDSAIDAYGVWCKGDPLRYVRPNHINLNIKYSTNCDLIISYAMGLQDWEDVRTTSNFTGIAGQHLSDSSWITKGNVANKRISDFLENADRSFALKIRHNVLDETFEMRTSSLNYSLISGYQT